MPTILSFACFVGCEKVAQQAAKKALEERTEQTVRIGTDEASKSLERDRLLRSRPAIKKPDAPWDEIKEKLAEASDKNGTALPVGFLNCVLLEPGLRAYDACFGAHSSQCFKTQFFAE